MARRTKHVKQVPVMVICHNITGKILLEIKGDSLWDRKVRNQNLAGAAMYAIQIKHAERSRNFLVAIRSQRAELSGADFTGSDLSGAVFSDEVMVGTNFSHTNLNSAVFVRTHFVATSFRGADFTGARFGSTAFEQCPSLGSAKGLDAIEHFRSSSLDADTLRESMPKLPYVFLRGIGYTNDEVNHFRTLQPTKGDLYSCFLSYARVDSEFAGELHDGLLKADVTCWQDVHDMRGGALWRGQIYDAIEKHDKLIVICSAASLTRPAVVEEIIEAIGRERRTGTQKLFPIRIDDFVFSDRLDALARDKVARGEWAINWVTYVRAYHIPDFSNWLDPSQFRTELNKLVNALKRPPSRPRGRAK